MALTAALLGWMFDGFEMGLFPLIGGPALNALLGPDGAGDTSKWFGIIIAVFLVGAATGGVFFGWLGDKIGRVRAMALSIFTYAIFTGFCGFATEAWHIAALRFIASLGMGGEWSLGVALVNELWPGKSRALVAGLIGAAANVGFLAVGLLSLGMNTFITNLEAFLMWTGLKQTWVDALLADSGWRFLMISGAFPALMIFFIRLFVPESEKWEEEKQKGGTTHWAKVDLFGVLAGCIAALVIIAFWSPYGAAFLKRFMSDGMVTTVSILVSIIGLGIALVGFLLPVRKYLERAKAAGSLSVGGEKNVVRYMLLGASLAAVAMLGTWGSIQWAAKWAFELAPDPARHAKEYTQITLASGAIVGTILAALCAGRFGRRITFVGMCIGSIASCLVLYLGNDSFGPQFLVCYFIAGAMTASFYGWFPLYLPELFPTAVRATGQGFAFNFGRIVAAIGLLQTATLIAFFDGNFAKAGSVLTVIYVIGIFIIWLGPETRGKALPE
ncbi:MAG: MFS transporter [Verrucomicrobia bacterium]|nr:MFS transporter [Verrucomicrobiota bacterium]